MAELLLELLSEEIPARMQLRGAEELRRLVTEKLEEARLEFSGADAHVTPRRLALVVAGLPARQPDLLEERKGPRVGAPETALQGFLKSAGLATIDQCERRTVGNAEFYFAVRAVAGRKTAEVLPELILAAVRALSWPKSQRWGSTSFRYVRPLHGVLAIFEGKVLRGALDLGGDSLAFGTRTRGHRFLSPKPFAVESFADYKEKLASAFVILDREVRKRLISARAVELATGEGLALREDAALLDEVAGLVEWPVPLIGSIDGKFMALPREVLVTTMRTNQRYFSLETPDGRLAPRFIVVANITASDGGAAIVTGNERVLRARLSDAKFFWDQDRKVPLAARLPKLAERVFHAKLGSMLDKIGRMMRLAEVLVPYLPGADPAKVLRAAELAKADLSSGMVGEFPDLQGVMGRYYALHDGEPAQVADAIAAHYSPLGPNDSCPTAPVSVAVALADKLDTLVAFFSIGETPTGSRDPFALRRAALGTVRLILENGLRIPLLSVLGTALTIGAQAKRGGFEKNPASELLAFFADRLKVHLREKGVRHDLITAVFTLGGEDDLVRLLARVEALDRFLKSDDGANLLVAYRRAANIVRIEEKQDGRAYDGPARREALEMPEEQTLAERLEAATARAKAALEREAFDEAMTALASLRGPVDEFFDRVTVNTDKPELRENRLRLLSEIRATLNRVADFSQIEG